MIFRALVIFYFSFVLVSPTSNQKRCYERYEDISSRKITGVWKENYSYQTPGKFDTHDHKPDCPFSSGYSCHANAVKTAHLKFTPNNCVLPEFNPYSFLQTLRNRRLFICGDSISLQFLTMLACSFHGAVKDISYRPISDLREKTTFQSGSSGEIYYPQTNTTIIYSGSHINHIYNKPHAENSFKDYIQFGKLFSPYDIVLLNFGAHFDAPAKILNITRRLAEEYNQTRTHHSSTHPILLWRETAPQHFHPSSNHLAVPMGYYAGSANQSCTPFTNYTRAYRDDFRNRISEKWMSKYSIPIMKIWNVSAPAWDQHYFSATKSDCTHFCEASGVYYYWRDLLFNIIPLLLQERKRELTQLTNM
jgi:hypothetical protein